MKERRILHSCCLYQNIILSQIKRSFTYNIYRWYNLMPNEIKTLSNEAFKRKLKMVILNKIFII